MSAVTMLTGAATVACFIPVGAPPVTPVALTGLLALVPFGRRKYGRRWVRRHVRLGVASGPPSTMVLGTEGDGRDVHLHLTWTDGVRRSSPLEA